MKDAKASIEEAIQVLEDNATRPSGLLRASGTAMGLLGNALAALESEEVVAEGWTLPAVIANYNEGEAGAVAIYPKRTSPNEILVRILAVKEGE